MASFKSVAYHAPRVVTFTQADATVPATGSFFIADDYYRVVSARARWGNVGSSGAAVTVYKAPSGTAEGSGTALHSTAFDLTGTADTTNTATLSTTAGVVDLVPGDALAVVFAGTLTNLAGLCVQVELKPTRVSNKDR